MIGADSAPRISSGSTGEMQAKSSWDTYARCGLTGAITMLASGLEEGRRP